MEDPNDLSNGAACKTNDFSNGAACKTIIEPSSLVKQCLDATRAELVSLKRNVLGYMVSVSY